MQGPVARLNWGEGQTKRCVCDLSTGCEGSFHGNASVHTMIEELFSRISLVVNDPPTHTGRQTLSPSQGKEGLHPTRGYQPCSFWHHTHSALSKL